MNKITPEQIDELLPQTQCGLCGHGGCMPYAEAILFENAPIDLCPPGGVETLFALGNLLNQDPTPYVAEMQTKTKPKMLATIREAECIGCTKCIQACPVDAILGSAKQMHTVIISECTGCELCVPPCPVDCIDIAALSDKETEAIKKEKANHARDRFHAKQHRLTQEKLMQDTSPHHPSLLKKQRYIQAAIMRAKAKKK
ncbi:MAG: RnfABCDGE type electron transport complex subunit B [Gammaproteobacteria bacterium]|nr:RnfABCDGE type electron transport complex subunit B [Gammaproteobacteria bacterium]MCW5583515.1 RnfABCDGE type electron transport complex subunit B [Gammaproteobacteria bacterium]